jgi:hypothetical protein
MENTVTGYAFPEFEPANLANRRFPEFGECVACHRISGNRGMRSLSPYFEVLALLADKQLVSGWFRMHTATL